MATLLLPLLTTLLLFCHPSSALKGTHRHGPGFRLMGNPKPIEPGSCLNEWKFNMKDVLRATDNFTQILEIKRKTMQEFEAMFLMVAEEEKECPKCAAALVSFKTFVEDYLCKDHNVTAGVIKVSFSGFPVDMSESFENKFGKSKAEGMKVMFPSVQHIVQGKIRRYIVYKRHSADDYAALRKRIPWMIPTPISLNRLGGIDYVNKTKIHVTAAVFMRIMANPPFEEDGGNGGFWATVCLVVVIVFGIFYVMVMGCFDCFGGREEVVESPSEGSHIAISVSQQPKGESKALA